MQQTHSISHDGDVSYSTFAIHTEAVKRSIQVMHTRLHEPLTIEDLASVAGLSPFHFHRVFRRQIGVPPGEFLSALRFQRARHLLLTTSLKVIDICFEVGYNSPGSFTSRFTQLVGVSPRLLRQRARAFEPLLEKRPEPSLSLSSRIQIQNTVSGRISVPLTFQDMIYIALFISPIPQGLPVRCTKVNESGFYLLPGVPDGVYYLRSAAFPASSDPKMALLPNEKILLRSNPDPLIVYNGSISGNCDLVLHSPHLTDHPLVMDLPLL